jgi:hypothetical protein
VLAPKLWQAVAAPSCRLPPPREHELADQSPHSSICHVFKIGLPGWPPWVHAAHCATILTVNAVHGQLNVADAHRDVKPVKNVRH